jgi:zinc D-Ala-D-Ala carboxypeptidase
VDRALEKIWDELGISPAILSAYRLPSHYQPALSELEVVDIDFEGKSFVLVSRAADAWREMVSAAASDTVVLRPFSGFRSYLHQKRLIVGYLKNGRALADILTRVAIPGFSEHHTGCAIDVHAEGRPVLEEEFEKSDAFAWLVAKAGRFGFRMSYPRGNALGIIYEPWHWCNGG